MFINPLAVIQKKLSKAIHRRHMILLMGMFFVLILQAQHFSRTYSVNQKGTPIGNLWFYHTISPEKTVLRLESHVKPRVVLDLAIQATEESTFENEILTYSSVYRCFNDKEKLNTQTRLHGDRYLIHKGDAVEVFESEPIRYNMLCLYAREPSHVSEVYSDIYQQFLAIEQIALQHYQVRFPDGNFNEYFYQNGICTKIIVHNPLYKATIELKT